MKWKKCIILFLAVFLAACSTRHSAPVETRFIASPNKQLQAIDSLMWRQPDSALKVLMDFTATPLADSLGEFNGHYCQMLFSELLFKESKPQVNREDLLKAMDYFDSLTIVLNDNPQLRSRHCGLGPQSPGQNDNIVFLDARAHYIKGVGFYERDSVVEACAEYLKTLELMETHFDEKDLVKNKAKFMEYTYNRLGDLFSGQFMMESAIVCYEKSLAFCRIEPTSPTAFSNIICRIGYQYSKLRDTEKAGQYFRQALDSFPQTQKWDVTYRDIVSGKAINDYESGMGLENSIAMMKQVVSLSGDEVERLRRCMVIGAIFFEEKMYDSAFYYIEPVYGNLEDESLKDVVAPYMQMFYERNEDSVKLHECMRFLTENNKPKGEEKALVSRLDNLFQDYLKQKQEQLTVAQHTKHIRRIVGIIVPIAVLLTLAIIVLAKLRSKKQLKERQDEADKALAAKEMEHEQEIGRLNADLASRRQQSHEAMLRQVKEIYFRQPDADEGKNHRLIMAEFAVLYPHALEDLRKAYPDLSDSEADICVLGFLGFRMKEMSHITGLSENTIGKYRSNIRKKIDTQDFDTLMTPFLH